MNEHRVKLKDITVCTLVPATEDYQPQYRKKDPARDKSMGKTVLVHETPYFKALSREDKATYDAYIKRSESNNPKKKYKEGSWDDFLALYKKIKQEGFVVDPKHPVVAGEISPGEPILPINITIGRKRIAILAHIYGPEATAIFKGSIQNRGIPLVDVS